MGRATRLCSDTKLNRDVAIKVPPRRDERTRTAGAVQASSANATKSPTLSMQTNHGRVGAAKKEIAMIDHIDALVTSYEKGTLTRRQLLQALAVIAVPAAADAQTAGGSVMKARNLHHVNLQVSDVPRSEAFYRRLFGFSPTRRVQGPDNHGFDLPSGGLIILQHSDTPGRIDHFCVGVDEFDAERLRAAAKTGGLEGVQGSASDNFFVRDPDGFRVQVSAVDWRA